MAQKRILITGAALLASGALFVAVPTVAQAQQSSYYNASSPLTGLYAGGYGGYSWSDVDISGGPGLDANDVDYGLFVGYDLGRLMSRGTSGPDINAAIEFHYGWAEGSDSSNGFSTEKDNEWGVSLRPGLTFMDSVMPMGIKPYGIIGYRNAKFTTDDGTGNSSNRHDGFELGLGTELVAFQNVGVRLDYTHVWYSREGDTHPSDDNLRLGVAYHF